SSRRRHTRFSRDWSSDVCSSDLARPNVHLVLVGSGSPLMETLQGIAAEKGLARRVHFLGMRQDVPQILNGSDIFALATETEATRSEERRVGEEERDS